MGGCGGDIKSRTWQDFTTYIVVLKNILGDVKGDVKGDVRAEVA